MLFATIYLFEESLVLSLLSVIWDQAPFYTLLWDVRCSTFLQHSSSTSWTRSSPHNDQISALRFEYWFSAAVRKGEWALVGWKLAPLACFSGLWRFPYDVVILINASNNVHPAVRAHFMPRKPSRDVIVVDRKGAFFKTTTLEYIVSANMMKTSLPRLDRCAWLVLLDARDRENY